MNNNSKDPTTTSPQLIENQIPKLQQALNRVISLTDRLSHSEYSSKCLNISPNISTLDTKAYSIVTCTIVALMLGFHFQLKDYSFLTYRFLWVLIALPMLYLFSKKLILPRKLILFLFVRFASSSIVYAFLYSRSFLYDFHAQSLEYDILAGNMCLALASLCSSTDSQQQVKRYIGVQSLSDFILTTCLRVYYDQPFDSKVYIHQFILLAFVSVACYLVSRKADLDRQALESNVIKHCEEISEELKEIHNNLKEEESQPTPLKEPTSSVADEILTKIKYLKFKLMQEEKERRFLNTKNSVFGPNKRGMVKGFSTIALTAKMAKKIDTVTISQRRGSYKEQDRSPPAEECLTSDSVEDNGVTKWQISAKDCDSLIRMMLQKQTNLYYPDVLKETNNQINTETAEFLKQHFTEIGNNLLSNEPSKERSNPLLDESKAFAYSVWSEYLEGNACTWNFDMLKFKDLTNGRHIPEYGNFIFKKFNILKTLNTSPNIVGNFLKDVSEGYLPNPYHNSIHGADVANSTAYFLTNDEFRGYFSELEVSCLLIAALVHDLGHPGFNNAFLVATKSTEALLYNDQSVLENLHTAYYYKILQKPSSNILQNLTENNQKVFRKLSIGLILDTDLTKHFVILTKFKGMADQINMEQEENRFLSLSIALKCADVAHGAKELSLHKKWSRRINEEFYLQGDKEREHGIPVSPLCDRAGKVSNSQHGFISFIVQPLFEAFDQKFFNDKMKEEVTDQVKKNLEYWKAEIPKEEIGESKFKEETQKTLEDIQSELPKVN